MKADGEGFFYPEVDVSKCVDCGLCVEVCPAVHGLAREEGAYFALRVRDEELLRQSSSGGAFSLLAESILEEGGVVCGAVFDGRFRVVHRLSETIGPMRKSKYVQSDPGSCFSRIRELLRAGRPVLFSGTPCQCHGLLGYLGERPEGLLLVSLVCRGVASPGLWEEYVKWLGGGASLEHFDFREKRGSRDGHAVSYRVCGEEVILPMYRDGFSRLYSLGLISRPSCYRCPYCRLDNAFDFTIGDFWGVEKLFPDLADGRGVSLVIARGESALRRLERLREKAKIVACTGEDALQPALTAPAKEPLLRRFLFRDFAAMKENGKCDFPLLLKKYSALQVQTESKDLKEEKA